MPTSAASLPSLRALAGTSSGVLTSPSNVRADVTRQFYEREEVRQMAEVLIDLEEDEVLRAAVVEVLERLDNAQ